MSSVLLYVNMADVDLPLDLPKLGGDLPSVSVSVKWQIFYCLVLTIER